MTSVKVKFTPSSVILKEGSVHYQIIHHCKVRHIRTGYKLFPSEWISASGEIPLMEQQKNDAGLNEVVKFAGVQPQEALQAYYDSIDILLMPSRSEGFGLTAIEGMARGCVVVAANTGGLPEVVSDGKVGLLHEPESSDSLAEKAIRLVNDRELLMTMKQNAIGHVARFSFAHYSELINNLYSKL